MRREHTREYSAFKVGLTGFAVGAAGWLASRLPGEAVDRVWPWMILVGGALLLGAIATRLRRTTSRLVLLGAALCASGGWFSSSGVPASTPGRDYATEAWIVGALLLAALAVWHWHRRGGSAGTVVRWARRGRRNHGMASWWAILRTSSWLAARRKAKTLRPSLRHVSWSRRLRTTTKELATPLVRVKLLRIWSPIEDVTLRIGGPRTGKTGELAGRILDAPGAVIATSTRTDLVTLTGPCRAQVGPVQVFNPSGLGGLASTVTFNPLSGCRAPEVAKYRAEDLLSGSSAPGSDGGDRQFWSGQARRVLTALLHAAALGDADMWTVQGWIANPGDPDTAAEIARFLRRSSEPAFEADAAQFLATNDRTRSSICATIMPALGWLTDTTAVAAASGDGLDVEQLLTERGTVYMLGAEDASVAPLVAALTGHVAREARRLAAHQDDGRLDPPLTLALDEAALICPIPLDNWTADMGGRNVTIHIAAQSRAQLRQRWGADGAAAILNNSATLLIFGGSRDPEDLQAYSTLTGERDEPVETVDADGRKTTSTTRRVPVLSPAQIAQLPAGKVLVIRRGMAPAIGRVRMAWKRHDVKAARRRAALGAALQRWQERRERFAAWSEQAGIVLDGYAMSLDDEIQAARRRFADWRATRRARKTSTPAQPLQLGPAIEHVEPADIDGNEGGDQR